MNKESKEHLSSLMDGEVSRETGRFLVRRLGADGDLRETWSRYHLIRDCLRHQEGQFAQADLSSRVRVALTDEPPAANRPGWKKTWLKPVAGAAVAASVAMVAILTVSNGNQPGATGLNPAASQSASVESFTSPNISSITPQSQPANLSGRDSQNSQKMNSYLLRHYQVTGDASGKGFVSFVPIVVTQAPSAPDPAEPQNERESDLDKQ